MYQLVRPRIAIPVHGEGRHLRAHAKLAEECQVSQALIVDNGEMVRLAPGGAEIVDDVPTGRLGVDGSRLLTVGEGALQSRRKMIFNGAAVATVVVDKAGRLMAPPQVSAPGLVEEGDPVLDRFPEEIEAALEELSPHDRRLDEEVREAARIAVRRVLRQALGKKPQTDIHVVRV